MSVPSSSFDPGGKLTPEALQRLHQVRRLGFHYREQLSGLAAEACELLGVDSEEESARRDWCEEIVFHGTDVEVAAFRVLALDKPTHPSVAG